MEAVVSKGELSHDELDEMAELWMEGVSFLVFKCKL